MHKMVSFHKVDPKWWSCERKKRYASLPDPMPKGMRSYECKYCLGIHLASDPLVPRTGPEPRAEIGKRAKLEISNHAIRRWQQRIENVSDEQAVTAILACIAAAGDRHLKPSKLRKRTFYIPTPKAMLIGSRGRLITVIERNSDEYAEAKAELVG